MLLGYIVGGRLTIQGAVGGTSSTLIGIEIACVSLYMLEALLAVPFIIGLMALENWSSSGCDSGVDRGGTEVGARLSFGTDGANR
jgi:hypothetical protein